MSVSSKLSCTRQVIGRMAAILQTVWSWIYPPPARPDICALCKTGDIIPEVVGVCRSCILTNESKVSFSICTNHK